MSDRFFPDSMPPPLADTTTLPWWEAAAEHRLVVQRCTNCGQTRHPPAPCCAECGSFDSDWQEVSGRGEVYTFTIVHRPIAAEQELPFLVAVIALEGSGGLRMISNLVDVKPEDVSIGMPVEVCFEALEDGAWLPLFKPEGS